MEIFKLFEFAIADIQPGHINTKDLRRDQLLDNYDEAIKTFQVLIKAKENEIAYRRDLIGMLEKSKDKYDNKLTQAKQAYQTAKKQAPESLNLKGLSKRLESTAPSTTPPLPEPPSTETVTTMTTTSSIVNTSSTLANSNSMASIYQTATNSQQSPMKGGNDSLDIPLPSDSVENRSSLDRRLSEFLKTFPNLTQAGLAQPSNNINNVKPMPGYYTQQPPPPPPISAAAPPLMAMMRFPPPPMVPPQPQTLHQNPITTHTSSSQQENHDTADMDLSDYDESGSNNNGAPGTTPAGGLIPMVASAMQQGAGGKHHLRSEHPPAYVAGQQFGNPISYQPRINPLPFDPSIMEPRLRDSTSSGRDKHSHSDRGGHRHSSSSGGSSGSVKHGSDKNKYSSSSSAAHSSGRSKRR